ncbi:MAG: signal peptidase II [Erysipelotrichaceae bacterium]|nr:signal peptidase II [Erysipelotrichaceae bacterium]
MRKRDWLFVITLILADQLSKLYISSTMQVSESIKVIENFFYITYARNTGAAWSIGQGMGFVFVGIAIAMSIGIVYYLYKHSDVKKLTRFTMLLIVAGGIGNAIDRIRFGYVIDFLDFYIFGYDFPIFNIADCCITIALFALILIMLTEKE